MEMNPYPSTPKKTGGEILHDLCKRLNEAQGTQEVLDLLDHLDGQLWARTDDTNLTTGCPYIVMTLGRVIDLGLANAFREHSTQFLLDQLGSELLRRMLQTLRPDLELCHFTSRYGVHPFIANAEGKKQLDLYFKKINREALAEHAAELEEDERLLKISRADLN